VFVVLHWGYEYTDVPARWQIDVAHALVDAGADAVIGHHPHVLQAIERYKHGVIAYSLGNFVFPNGKERIRETGVLRLGFQPRPRACTDLVAFHPAIQVRGQITHPEIPTPPQLEMMRKRLFALWGAKPFSTTWRLETDRFVTDPACT
jgi:poly-gamma-glutamate synthesis protein (capsule biosynthesis protein)